jgi:Zn-dependent protease
MSERISMMLMLLPGLIVGLTVHEAAHAFSAKLLGDTTAERLGRVSLNPLRHLTLWGTAALFLIGIGWGKPVPVNLNNFTKPKFHYLLTSLAGPASNLLLASVALGILHLRPPFLVEWICFSIFMINSMLAVFNLLPIPPLDGSKIWPCIIPGLSPAMSAGHSRMWMIVFIAAIYLGAIEKVMSPAFKFLFTLLPAA